MGPLSGRVALVTGAAGTLGLSHASHLAKQGASVALVDLGSKAGSIDAGYPLTNNEQLGRAADAVRELGVATLALTADVRNQDDLDRAVARTIAELGGLHIVVANAGIVITGSAWEVSRDEWDLQMAVNLTGVWQTSKAAIPHLIGQRYGRIVAVASDAGIRGYARLSPYCASKAAVIGYARSLAWELAEFGVTVNCVCPATVPSGASRGVAAREGLNWTELVSSDRAQQAIKTTLTASDISAAVAFLASDEARHITGVALPVDAGATA